MRKFALRVRATEPIKLLPVRVGSNERRRFSFPAALARIAFARSACPVAAGTCRGRADQLGSHDALCRCPVIECFRGEGCSARLLRRYLGDVSRSRNDGVSSDASSTDAERESSEGSRSRQVARFSVLRTSQFPRIVLVTMFFFISEVSLSLAYICVPFCFCFRLMSVSELTGRSRNGMECLRSFQALAYICLCHAICHE